MNANHAYRQRSNTIGDIPRYDMNEDSPVTCPDWGGMEEQIFSRSWSSSGSISDSVTDDSLEDSIEDKHFAKAVK